MQSRRKEARTHTHSSSNKENYPCKKRRISVSFGRNRCMLKNVIIIKGLMVDGREKKKKREKKNAVQCLMRELHSKDFILLLDIYSGSLLFRLMHNNL